MEALGERGVAPEAIDVASWEDNVADAAGAALEVAALAAAAVCFLAGAALAAGAARLAGAAFFFGGGARFLGACCRTTQKTTSATMRCRDHVEVWLEFNRTDTKPY